MIWKVIEVILAEYPLAQGSIAIQYGWYALIFAAVGILLYVSGLLCSHLAAFRIASNMRKKLYIMLFNYHLDILLKKEVVN